MDNSALCVKHGNEPGTLGNPNFKGLLAMARSKRDQKTKDLFAYAEDNRPSIVYMATNTVNGKRYIGITRKTLEARRLQHFAHARNDPRDQHFYRALRKYGAAAFEFTLLRQCDSYRSAQSAERGLIAQMRPEYNKTAGGEGVVGHRHNKETRRKMSAAKKGRSPWPTGQYPAEVRAKISKASRARRGTYNHSEAIKAVIRQNARLANEARRRPVICLTDWLAFPSLHEAEAYYGLNYVLIGHYCRGAKNQRNADRFGRKGLEFAYVKDIYAEAAG